MLKLLIIPFFLVFGLGGGLLAVAIQKRMKGEDVVAQQYQDAGDMVLREGSKFLKYLYTFLLGFVVVWAIGVITMIYLIFDRR